MAVITAGRSGMGAAAALRLAADGFKVAVLSSSALPPTPSCSRMRTRLTTFRMPTVRIDGGTDEFWNKSREMPDVELVD